MIGPFLTPVPPTPGADVAMPDVAPLAIGARLDNSVVMASAGVAPHHAILEPRGGAWWIRPLDGPVAVNGVTISGPQRLGDRDRIELAPGIVWEFATGEKRTRRMESAAEMIARPRKRTSGRLPGPRRKISLAAIGTAILAGLLVGTAVYAAWYAVARAPRSVVVLDDRQAAELDSLLVTAYDHIERGGTLLELGLGDGAADEFARAVNTLALSDLRNHPQVRPRILAIEATVGSIYRERSLAVPSNYANATSPLTAEQLKTASLSVDDFAAKVGLMSATFQAQFGHEIVVSGRDHAEHVILYGKGGAMDLSIKEMRPAEIGWIVDRCHAYHIRVKDFSQDSVLRRQVATAVKAGLLFEAGTGLHLHIDRFANKRDRWTTTGGAVR